MTPKMQKSSGVSRRVGPVRERAGVLLADVVNLSAGLARERGRTAKRDAVAALLAQATQPELAIVLGLLRGEPRQGRVGVGWRTLAGLDVAHATEPTLDVADVDRLVDALAVEGGNGSAARRVTLLTDVFGRATATEADYLWRVFGGEVRHGALDGVLADAVAAAEDVPAAVLRRAAMFLGDLAAAAVVARSGGAAALADVGLTPGRPVQPMLAAPAADVAEALGAGPASVEWKLDGARIQAHRTGHDVRLFTRNLNDVTPRLGDVVAAVRALPAESCVLDGEVLGVDDDGRPGAFQDTMSSFSADASRPGLRVWFFDLLHLDGRSLVDEPLAVRRDLLERLVGPLAVPALRTSAVAEATAFADAVVAAGHEGVVVKDLASPYEAGRRGSAWRKVKPVHTVDLVVLAAEWGHGRRKGWLSNLHLGARDPSDDGSFVMVGKTFKGMTDELLAWQTETLSARAVDRPAWGVTVAPELVVEIALDGVQRSRRYAGGVALRFARLRRYRADKGPHEADDLAALRRLLPVVDRTPAGGRGRDR